jgi:hypothetical protein
MQFLNREIGNFHVRALNAGPRDDENKLELSGQERGTRSSESCSGRLLISLFRGNACARLAHDQVHGPWGFA